MDSNTNNNNNNPQNNDMSDDDDNLPSDSYFYEEEYMEPEYFDPDDDPLGGREEETIDSFIWNGVEIHINRADVHEFGAIGMSDFEDWESEGDHMTEDSEDDDDQESDDGMNPSFEIDKSSFHLRSFIDKVLSDAISERTQATINRIITPWDMFLCLIKSLNNEKFSSQKISIQRRIPQIPVNELQGPQVKKLQSAKPSTLYFRETSLTFRNSPSFPEHHQCAGSIVLGPPQRILRLENQTVSNCIIQIPTSIVTNTLNLAGVQTHTNVPDLYPNYTYRAQYSYWSDEVSHINQQCSVDIDGLVMCIAQKYGLLATGTEEGDLIVISTEHWEQNTARRSNLTIDQFISLNRPKFTLKTKLTMTNSIDISRRFVRKNDEFYGQELTILSTQNHDGIHVIRLFIDKNYEITTDEMSLTAPFEYSNVNDGKISPNKENSIFVGDDGCIWFSKILYSNDVIEIKEDSDIDIENEGWEDVSEDELLLSDDDNKNEDEDQENARTVEKEKDCKSKENMKLPTDSLTWSFAGFKKLSLVGILKESLTYTVSMQHVSWNCDSNIFAISCDSDPYIIVGVVEDEEPKIKAALPVFGPTLAIEFHPKNYTLLAFAYDKGYMHVVDLDKILRIPGTISNADVPPLLDHQDYIAMYYAVTLNEARNIVEHKQFLQQAMRVNGMKWSDEGDYLYLALKDRVEVHQSCKVPSLYSMCMSELFWAMRPISKQGVEYKKPFWMREQDFERSWKLVKEWGEQQSWWPFWWS